jgi:O-antigen ligase
MLKILIQKRGFILHALKNLLLPIVFSLLLSCLIFYSPEHSLLLVFCLIMMVIIKKKPEVGFLLIVIFLSSVVFLEAIPSISIGIGSIYVQDIIFIYMATLALFSRFGKNKVRSEINYFSLFLVLFYLACIVSLLNALVLNGVAVKDAVGQFRALSYYLLYFLVIELIQSKKQVCFLVNGLFIIGSVVGITMLIQAGIGDSVQLMPGKVQAVATFGQTEEATRILPPGQSLMYFLFILSVAIISLTEKYNKLFLFFILPICGAGVLLTYNRNYWVACILIFLLIFMFGGNKSKSKIVFKILSPCFVLIAFFSIFAFSSPSGKVGSYFFSLENRFTSIFASDELYDSKSIDWRRMENVDAVESILNNPVLGVGLGNKYRDIHDKNRVGLESYIHNGYLWVFTKMGLVGLVPFLGLFVSFLWRSIRSLPNVEGSYFKALFAGIVLSVLGTIIMNVVNPMFMQLRSIVVISILIGIAEVLNRISLNINCQCIYNRNK